MLMIMLLALRRTGFTGLDAGFELCAQDDNILPGSTDRNMRCGRTDVRAVMTHAYAQAHIHRFCSAGIGARGAEQRAQHGMPRRSGDRFAEIVADIGVKPDHLLDRHRRVSNLYRCSIYIAQRHDEAIDPTDTCSTLQIRRNWNWAPPRGHTTLLGFGIADIVA